MVWDFLNDDSIVGSSSPFYKTSLSKVDDIGKKRLLYFCDNLVGCVAQANESILFNCLSILALRDETYIGFVHSFYHFSIFKGTNDEVYELIFRLIPIFLIEERMQTIRPWGFKGFKGVEGKFNIFFCRG